MKKSVLVLAIALLQLTALFADYKDYEMELVHTFKDDYNIEDLETDMSGFQSNGPSAYTFDEEGNLYVLDSLQRRLVMYNLEFEYINHIPAKDFYPMLRIEVKGDLILCSSDKNFFCKEFEGKTLFDINIYKMKKFKQVSFNTYFNYVNNTVTLSTRRGEIYTLKNPGLDNKYNEKNLIKVEEVEPMADSSRSSGSETEFISSYFNFIEDIEPEVQSRTADTKLMSLSDIEIESPSTMRYVGKDSDGNYYWNDSYKHIIIINKDKQLIDAFNIGIERVRVDPVVRTNGDVYFMDIYEDGTDLYRVKRVW